MDDKYNDMTGVEFEDFDFDDFEFEELDPLDVQTISKKTMVIFFVIDTSESMRGKKIKDLNDTMRELIPSLAGIGGANTDIKYAVLSFSSGCEWKTPEPYSVDENISWRELEAGGITDLGMALEELNVMLSRKKFLKAPSVCYAPVTFLMTDGYPTDNYKKALNALKQNSWYKHGINVALGIGDGFNKKVLEEFTGNVELVLEVSKRSQLKKVIRTIAVTSSQIGSNSVNIFNDDNKELTYEDVMYRKKKDMIDSVEDLKEEIKKDDLDSDFEDDWIEF